MIKQLKKFIKKLKQKRIKSTIVQSGLFDESWYKNKYVDLKDQNIDAVDHYLQFGYLEGRDPSPSFNTSYYLSNNHDVKLSGMNPLLHFILAGKIEGRRCLQPLDFDCLTSEKEAAKTKLTLIQHDNSLKMQERPLVGVYAYITDISILSELIKSLRLVSDVSVVCLSTTSKIKDAVNFELVNILPNLKVNFITEFSNHNDAYLQALEVVFNNQIELLLHIQQDDLLASDLSKKPHSNLIPLIANLNVINDIFYAFNEHDDIGFIGGGSAFLNNVPNSNVEKSCLINCINSIGFKEDPTVDYGGFVSSSYWARVEHLLPLLKLQGSDYSTGKQTLNIDNLHGILAKMSNARFALSFSRNNKIDSFSVIAIPRRMQSDYLINSDKGKLDQQLISAKEDFDYLSNSGLDYQLYGAKLDGFLLEPINYYVRYGVFFGDELSESFNSKLYKYEHLDNSNGTNPFINYLKVGQRKREKTFPNVNSFQQNKNIVLQSGLFDSEFYLKENPDVLAKNIDPLEHFCVYGWRELREPNPNFDLWQYWQRHLDSTQELINPLVHSIINEYNEPVEAIELSKGLSYESHQEIRRVCLFAGYDSQGVIDTYVVDYLAEISKYADIYYLADSEILADEMNKISHIVKGAWSFRHGAYDFGSYAKLALHLVGWENICDYDELILANDSCYLIDKLGPVFDKMDQQECDWWGMQATKGLFRTREKESNSFAENIPLSVVKERYLESYNQEYMYDFHIGSYFLTFRKEVLLGGDLEEVFKSVKKEKNKLNIIRKYEIGLTQRLINAGFNFSCFIDELYTFHPIYTNNHFALIEQGFPFLKRFLLTENHYKIPNLYEWENKLEHLKPGINLKPINDNILRIADNEKLYRNLNITLDSEGEPQYPELLTDEQFKQCDLHCEKHDDWWVFPVCAYDNNFTGNERALFEQVKNDKSIKKIILTRKNHIDIEGDNVEIVPLKSKAGQEFLLGSKYIFIKHTAQRNTVYPLDPKQHFFINLWHGIPLKRIGYTSKDLQHLLEPLGEEHAKHHSVICSSDVDRLAMASAFYPLTYNDMWITGLPRIDLVLKSIGQLPSDLLKELNYIKERVGNKKLILFCPTFKNGQDGSYYRFTPLDKLRLETFLKDNNYILGIREHMADKANSYYANLSELPVINLNNNKVSNIEMIYRVADILITDYSSCFIDFMVTGKPIFSFAYDYEHYINSERGLFYDLEFAVPGKVCKSFDGLIKGLQALIEEPDKHISKGEYQFKQNLFFKYLDANNSQRLVDKIKELYKKEL
ncbi:CDP-glycerol glycerophosphotransferase family protein [Thalassotalea psychrophila]|uniref:CDP-glycerol glycerophosphotransferase family protein n=1 Tax=Thalassotalea psychrophila TaxID=3065647 RepID=A0ABY9TR58_9GAMM|nr:CDP-glycerol glycerophosphotransferase family protein [Colwelliaceae bacterium SQ149]